MKQRLFTGAAGIQHIVPLSVSKIIGIKNIREAVEERDRTINNKRTQHLVHILIFQRFADLLRL